MFSLRGFIKKGLLYGVGKMADYQIILNATGWYEKGVLLVEDLEEINKAIEENYKEETIEDDIKNEEVIENEENQL